MRQITIAVIVLLTVLHFNAHGQIIKDDFSIDKYNKAHTKWASERKAAKEHAKEAAQAAKEALEKAATLKVMIPDAEEEKSAIVAYDVAKIQAINLNDDAADSAQAASDWNGYIFGTGTVANLENTTTPSGNISIGGVLTYSHNSILFAFNGKPAATPDSANLKNTFLFPEISSRLFTFEYERALNKKKKKDGSNNDDPLISTNFFLNFSYTASQDTNKNKINPYNLLSGFRFSIHKDLSKQKDTSIQKLKNLSVSLSPYFSMIHIDPNDFKSYQAMFVKTATGNAQPDIYSLGGKFTFQVGNLQVFFDYKYILNAPSNSVFTNSYATIGTAVNTKIFSFL